VGVRDANAVLAVASVVRLGGQKVAFGVVGVRDATRVWVSIAVVVRGGRFRVIGGARGRTDIAFDFSAAEREKEQYQRCPSARRAPYLAIGPVEYPRRRAVHDSHLRQRRAGVSGVPLPSFPVGGTGFEPATSGL